MSAASLDQAGGKGGKDQDFELNLASIIDCFVVLITYLLVSASFISLSALDVTVASPIVPQDRAAGSSVSLSIDMESNRSIAVKLTGSETRSLVVAAKEGKWDFEGLGRHLKAVKERHPDLNAGLLTADNKVEYRAIVKAVETARGAIPAVSLGDREIE